MLIVVPASSRIQTFGDLVAAARSSSLNAGSSGNGTPPHLTLALFNDTAKTKIQHVPYKGGAPAMTDLVGGQLDVVFSNFPESFAHVKSGKLRALAIASVARHPALPDVPTTSEAGMPALLVENWTAMMVPSGTPDADRRQARHRDRQDHAQPGARRARAHPGLPRRCARAGKFAAFLDDEVQRWSKIIKAANITAE